MGGHFYFDNKFIIQRWINKIKCQWGKKYSDRWKKPSSPQRLPFFSFLPKCISKYIVLLLLPTKNKNTQAMIQTLMMYKYAKGSLSGWLTHLRMLLKFISQELPLPCHSRTCEHCACEHFCHRCYFDNTLLNQSKDSSTVTRRLSPLSSLLHVYGIMHRNTDNVVG